MRWVLIEISCRSSPGCVRGYRGLTPDKIHASTARAVDLHAVLFLPISSEAIKQLTKKTGIRYRYKEQEVKQNPPDAGHSPEAPIQPAQPHPHDQVNPANQNRMPGFRRLISSQSSGSLHS
jgi:hypothetical protein